MTKLKISYDTADTNWISELIESRNEINYVNGILPKGYDRYIKIFFPVGIEGEEFIEPKTYQELCDFFQVPYNKTISFTDFIDNNTGYLPDNWVIIKELDITLINELIAVIGKDTPSTIHGFGDDIVPELFEQEWILSGQLEILEEVFNQLNEDGYMNFNFFPNYIYAQDKSWCIGQKIFQSGIILLGCNNQLADEILNNTTIDSIEINYDDKYFNYMKPKYSR